MITSAEIEPGGWTPIPHATARDPRIDRRALGLLVEVLSYPPGWNLTMDALGETGREGRDANRAAFGKLVAAGYIIEHRYRERGRWKTATFGGVTPEQAQRLADEWLNEHPELVVTEKPRSRPKTEKPASVEPASENPVSYRKTERKTEEEDGAVAQAPDKSVAPSKTGSFAEVRAAAPTSSTGSLTGKSAKTSKRRTAWPSNEQRDADWRAQIVAADVDELDDVLSTSSHGKSARRMSSFRLGFGTRGSVPNELYPQYVRHAYLYLLKDVAETDPEHLDDLKYALDETIKAGRAPYKWDHTEHVPAGETAASFSVRMIQVAASMPPEQLGPWAAEIEDFLPGLWYEKRHEAREQVAAQGLPMEIETIASVAVRLMIQYYANKSRPKWPAEVVPPSMRTVASITDAPSWAA